MVWYEGYEVPLVTLHNTIIKSLAHAQWYGAPFVSKFFLKDYGSGTNQMGGFVGGAPFLQMADSWTRMQSRMAGFISGQCDPEIAVTAAKSLSSLSANEVPEGDSEIPWKMRLNFLLVEATAHSE